MTVKDRPAIASSSDSSPVLHPAPTGYFGMTLITLVLAALAGCGSAPNTQATIGPTSTASPVPSSSPSALPAPTWRPAKDGTNLAACRDGNCEIQVAAPADITFDRTHFLSSIHLEPTGAAVNVTCHSADGGTLKMSTNGTNSGGTSIGAAPTAAIAGDGGEGTVSESDSRVMTFALRVEVDGIPILGIITTVHH
jgi:hypothetical protein